MVLAADIPTKFEGNPVRAKCALPIQVKCVIIFVQIIVYMSEKCNGVLVHIKSSVQGRMLACGQLEQ